MYEFNREEVIEDWIVDNYTWLIEKRAEMIEAGVIDIEDDELEFFVDVFDGVL